MSPAAYSALALLPPALLACTLACATPPHSGTIFIGPDIITSDSPTTFTGTTYKGQGIRNMFDRRLNDFADFNAYLFDVTYSDGFVVEFEVDPEYGSAVAAQVPVDYYAPVLGRLPKALRMDVQKIWMHMGDEVFGGGNNAVLIHTGSIAQGYIDTGILEEALAHEATHTSLDASVATSPGWLAAQAADGEFISDYAHENPTREDVAESFVPWLAVTVASTRISASDRATIRATIPHRLAYFNTLNLDLTPLPTIFADGFD